MPANFRGVILSTESPCDPPGGLKTKKENKMGKSKKWKKSCGHKPLIDFNPHSLSDCQELEEHPNLRELLKHINLYYSVYKTVPPIGYLQFVMGFCTKDDLLKAIGYLSQYDWFIVIKSNKRYNYLPTEKFLKAFYHSRQIKAAIS